MSVHGFKTVQGDLRRQLRAWLFATSAGLGLTAMGSPVLAQQAAVDHAKDATTVEGVVVTAEKRSQTIQTVPSSITAIGEDLIDRVQAGNLNDLAAYVPGLNVEVPVDNFPGAGANRLIVRGLSSGPNDISPTVGVYVDDAPFGSNTGHGLGALLSPDVDPFDLDHIEVLRGPQGTLYGASTLGGLVKYVSKAPDTHSFSAHTRIDLGDVDETGAVSESFRAGLNLPIVQDKIALRVSGFYAHADGDVTNVRTGQDGLNSSTREGGHADLLIQPNESLKIDLSAIYKHSSSPHVGAVFGDGQTLEPIYDRHSGYDYIDGFGKSKYYVLEGRINYEFANGVTATSVTSYSDFKVDNLSDITTILQPALGGAGPLFEFAEPQRVATQKLSQEFRLASPSNEHFEWLAGFFYDYENSDYLAAIHGDYIGGACPTALQGLCSYLSNYETADSIGRYVELAAFANATYYLTSNFDISLGLRGGRNDQHLTVHGSGTLAALGIIPVLARATSEDTVFTESVGVRWRFQPNQMLYARFANGYRPGGPNLTGTSFAPDTSSNYEVGLKSTALDGRLTASLAAFYVDWKNIQLNFFNGTNTIIGNAGNARSQGVEFEGVFVPVDGLTLAGNFAYTDAKITSLIPGALGGASVGDQLPFSSKWTGALRADYSFPVSADVEGNIGMGVRYKSAFNTTFPGDPGNRRYRLPSQTFVDLRTGVRYRDYSLNFQVLNVFDTRRLSNAVQFLTVPVAAADAFGQPTFITYAPGRTFQVSLTAQF